LYRCEVCSVVVPPRTPSCLIVVATRAVVYPHREKVHYRPPEHGGKGKKIDDPGGVGFETVRALRACPSCAGTGPPR